VLVSTAVDRVFEPSQVKNKDYTIGICCFSDNHTVSKSKSRYGSS